MYQTICSRMLARSGYNQSGGAFGFRDQLQDVLSIMYFDPDITRKQILLHASHQFEHGDVEHWWHEETGRGIRTRFSDDLLWLPYVTCEYIKYTGDTSILDEVVPYKYGKELEMDVDERYDLYNYSENEGSIYEHCKKAIKKACDFGRNGLPKIGSGDWNDGFNKVGNKGIGESVWLGFFLYKVLDSMQNILKIKQEENLIEEYENIKENIKKNINTKAWDGEWYKRAFTDSGEELGSRNNDECKIDSISQSWSVISKAGDNDKKYIAMDSLEKFLILEDTGIIKLLDPPFDKGKLEPGYIKSYLPGTRENGGQYTHASMWCIIAETILGFTEKGFKHFNMINPIEHSKNKEEAKIYRVEPYVFAADIYGYGNLLGRGGWTWYTGSSSWAYITVIKYILGLNINEGYLEINPCIPNDWKEYEIHFHFKESIYHIKVINKKENSKEKDSKKVIWKCNGKVIEDKKIKLDSTGKIYQIDIQL